MVATKLQKSSRRNQKKHRAAHQQASSKDSRRKKMKRENHCEIQGSSVGESKLTHQSDALPSCIDKLREELSCSASSTDSRRKKMKRENHCEIQGSSVGENKLTHQSDALPSCIDKLREELSCSICLEICYGPTSTWCGHSFCRRCLIHASEMSDKKCPVCRRYMCKYGSEHVDCFLNEVLWNTIKLLFPQEVEARKAAAIMNDLQRCEIQGSSVGESKLTHQSDALPSCIDKLREELSCLICLEICYEPMSTWCGHSFCRKCMKIAPIKYHKKCPKCRRFIGKVRNYRVNTVIWNTIRLLFPQEVEVRKVAKILNAQG